MLYFSLPFITATKYIFCERILNLVMSDIDEVTTAFISKSLESREMFILILKAKVSGHCGDKLLLRNACDATAATISAAELSLLSFPFFSERGRVEK